MLTEDVMVQIECVPRSHNLVAQVEGIKDATPQTSILFSEIITQTNFNTPETQTDKFDLINCGTQTVLLSDDIISKIQSMAKPHKSNSLSKSYTNSTGSQCCILSIPNDLHLDILKALSLEARWYCEWIS
ncbi:uncharacterized protein LOC126900753 [Daktulosphaira vitifoliae]|uniref:uncharacterized protein LOC126900753 n=1 Tax=Daktulosphaira vitifoliae TaxID=58002 RepID=UPI0021AA3BF3|nr:uncharacterized protein LOC126900753 [Daktulosphaira vitifoliae]